MDKLVEGKDIVLNFAAETHVDRSILHAEDFINTNVGLLIFTLTPSALAKPLTKVVFPAPNGPSMAIMFGLKANIFFANCFNSDSFDIWILVIGAYLGFRN